MFISMEDFEQFDAFQRCREFGRAVAEPLNRGASSKDPVLVTQLLGRSNASPELFEAEEIQKKILPNAKR
jgi:hypothetical protein